MNETQHKTYTVATCASGCSFHSTAGDITCRMCEGPMSAPVTTDRAGMLALFRNEAAYQAGKRAHCAAVGITI